MGLCSWDNGPYLPANNDKTFVFHPNYLYPTEVKSSQALCKPHPCNSCDISIYTLNMSILELKPLFDWNIFPQHEEAISHIKVPNIELPVKHTFFGHMM